MKSLRRTMAKMPTLLLLGGTGVLLTVLGMAGRNTLYGEQELDTWKKPMLALVFQGINEEKYPWQIFAEEGSKVTRQIAGLAEGYGENIYEENVSAASANGQPANGQLAIGDALLLTAAVPAVSGAETPALGAPVADASLNSSASDASPSPSAVAGSGGTTDSSITSGSNPANAGTSKNNPINPGNTANSVDLGKNSVSNPKPAPPLAPIKPLRSTTHEEYLNYISADIYGTAGVERAGEYGFVPVAESYFDDALFIGDSRTVGLRDYSSLSEHGDFLCATALTIFRVLEDNIGKEGTVAEALEENDYKKIYLSVGINELGRGTTEDYLAEYREVVNYLRKTEPEALIMIQAVMKVTRTKNDQDAIINNSNIEARNRAIATLADNRQVFYIDVNEAVSDTDGNLTENYTHDGIHLLASYNEDIKQFLLSHGVSRS